MSILNPLDEAAGDPRSRKKKTQTYQGSALLYSAIAIQSDSLAGFQVPEGCQVLPVCGEMPLHPTGR